MNKWLISLLVFRTLLDNSEFQSRATPSWVHLEGAQGAFAPCYILTPLGKISLDHLEDFAARLASLFSLNF